MCDEFSYDNKKDVIDGELRKQRSKWFLDTVSHIGWDDIEQIIRSHIYSKWDLWDQKKPLQPWLHQVISNQIKNLIRNHYGSFAKPCAQCSFNTSSKSEKQTCDFTPSGEQDDSCPIFLKWSKTKRYAYNLKLPVSMETHINDVFPLESNYYDLDRAVKNLNTEMERLLSKKRFRIYKMMFIDFKTDEQVLKALGYKTLPSSKATRDKQIKKQKNEFLKIAKQALKDCDIL